MTALDDDLAGTTEVPAIGNAGLAATDPDSGLLAPDGPPDTVWNGGHTSMIEVRAASVRGLLHKSAGQPRQDAYAYSWRRPAPGPDSETETEPRAKTEELVVAVCDGVGSLRLSHLASSRAASGLVELATLGLTMQEAFETVNDTLRAADDLQDGDELLAATTAILLRVRCDDGGCWHGAVASVGDCQLWALCEGDWTRIAPADSGDADPEGFYTARTDALPARTLVVAEEQVEIEAAALFLMSDGVAGPLASASPVRSELAEWWQRPPEARLFERQVAFARKSHLDDRSVFGMWPR